MGVKEIFNKIWAFLFLPKGKNFGLIVVPPTETDYIANVRGDVVTEVINEYGDWQPYSPTEEAQNSVYFDSFACVSFWANNTVEHQLNFFIATKQLSQAKIEWLEDNGYIENGKVNLSDRFLAKVSGTTRTGATVQSVCDAFRHFGAVPEKDWDYPRLQRTPVFDWDDYYAPIPQHLLDKGIEFLRVIGAHPDPKDAIKYEWVYGDFEKHLKQAPLGLTIPLCPGWNTGDVAVCGLTKGTHEVTLQLIHPDQTYEIFDSYPPFYKVLAPGYPVPWVMKLLFIINKKSMYQLVRKQDDEDTYYLEEKTDAQGIKVVTRVHIGDSETFDAYQGKLWGDRSTIKIITPAEFNAIKKSGVILKTNSL